MFPITLEPIRHLKAGAILISSNSSPRNSVGVDLAGKFFSSLGRFVFPPGTLLGPLPIEAPKAGWFIFRIRIKGNGPFNAPQLLIESQNHNEQNIPIAMTAVKFVCDTKVFTAIVGAQYLAHTIHLMPSISICEIEEVAISVLPIAKSSAVLRLATLALRHPRLVLRSLTSVNLGFQFATRTDWRPRAVLADFKEILVRNIPNPNCYYSGDDPSYSRWINCNFETLLPRTRPVALAATAPKVAVEFSDGGSRSLTLTLNSLVSAGIPVSRISIIGSMQTDSPVPSLIHETSAQFLNSLIPDGPESFFMVLKNGDAVSRDFLALALRAGYGPSLGIAYFDHDSLGTNGGFKDYQFKPDMSPTTILFNDFVSRSAIIKATLLKQDPSPTAPGTGKIDLETIVYSCVLNAFWHFPDSVRHVPIPAYHMGCPTPPELGELKSSAGKLLLEKYAPGFRTGIRSGAAIWQSNKSRQPAVSILIPTRNRADLLQPAIESITRLTNYQSYRIVVLDNQSNDPDTLSYLSELERGRKSSIKRFDEPFNFARMHNQIIGQIDTEYALLLNNDIEITKPDWLTDLVSLFELPHVGIVGNKLLYPDGTVQHAGAAGGLKGPMAHYLVGIKDDSGEARLTHPRDVLGVTGACLLIPTQLYTSVGGMDERLAVSYNDMDLCLSVRTNRSKSVIVSSSGGVVHKESKSRGKQFTRDEQAVLDNEADYFDRKWREYIRPDPFYNPNFSLVDDFTLR